MIISSSPKIKFQAILMTETMLIRYLRTKVISASDA